MKNEQRNKETKKQKFNGLLSLRWQYFGFFLLLFVTSCDYETVDETSQNVTEPVSTFAELESKMSNKERLKVKFARKLALAVSENQDLRLFLKTEALKMINNDYDVFYPVIKDKSILGDDSKSSSNPSSFRNTLLPYFENESELNEIEQQLPLLTIFVPELPENSFSAAMWDTTNPASNPVVAIRLSSSNDIPVIDIFHGEDYVIESDLIPSYPVIVIKDNERIQVNNGNSAAKNLIDNPCSQVLSPLLLEFTDNNFNPCITYSGGGGGSPSGPSGPAPCNAGFEPLPGRDSTVDQFLINSYNAFNGATITNPWHRDNIYYNLTATQPSGAFVGGRYVEAVTYFRINGDAKNAFSTISDQTGETGDRDPVLANHDWDHDQRNRTPWTDGNFEIQVVVFDGNKSEGVEPFQLFLDARPGDLFEYSQETVTRRRGFVVRWDRTYWRPIVTGFKGLDLSSRAIGRQTGDIHPWDLDRYSRGWRLEFYENDNTEEVQTSVTNSVKYSRNIEISANATINEKVKVGLKDGVTLATESIKNTVVKYKLGRDELGFLDANFEDTVLSRNNCDNQLYPRVHRSSKVMIELRPVQVEF
jgi:hypothetical protein